MKTNVVFIMADDLGYWAIGRNCRDAVTPNIDELCDKGSYYENFYCASPVCSPARASVLTGLMPSAHGVHDWIRSGNVDRNDSRISEDVAASDCFAEEKEAIDYLCGQRTYLDFFRSCGYRTALFGKWHLGDSVKCGGFDTHVNITKGGCSYYNADVLRNGRITFENEYITDIITRDAVNYINAADADEPFYMNVNYTAPHSPWDENEHPREYIKLFRDCEFSTLPDLPVNPRQIKTAPIGDCEAKRRSLLMGYFAAVSAMDAGIGRILEALNKRKIAEKTLVVFTSDNGMNMGHHGIWGKGNGTYPQNLYETSVRVPFVTYIKGQKPRVINECYSHVDIFPTFADMTGSEAGNSARREGRVLPLTDGAAASGKSVFIVAEYGRVRMLRKNGYKLILDFICGDNMLFDLDNDPDETENLYGLARYSDIINDMRGELDSLFDRLGDVRYSGLNQHTYGTGQLSAVKPSESAEYLKRYDFYYDSTDND